MFGYILNRFKDSFFYLASSVLILPLSLITSPLFAQNLSSTDFAAIGFFSNLQIYLLPMMNLSFYSYYMTGYHERSDNENDYVLRTLFSFLILINIVVSTASYFALKYYLDISESSFNSYPLGLVVILSGMLSISLGFWNIRLRFQRKSFKYFIINLITSILSICIGLLLVIYFQLGAFGKLVPTLFINAVFFIIFLLKYIKTMVIDLKIIRNAINFCYPLIFAALLSLPVQYIDKFFLERLHNVNEFAFYNIADNISGYFMVFSAAVVQTFEPDIFKFTGLRNKRSVIKVFLLFSVTLFAGAFFLWLISERAVDFLTAGKYLGATKYMRIMLVAKCLEPILYFFSLMIISLHLTKILLFNKLLMALISIPLFVYMINQYSFLGAIYAKITIFVIWLLFILLEIYLSNSRLIKKLYVKHKMA